MAVRMQYANERARVNAIKQINAAKALKHDSENVNGNSAKRGKPKRPKGMDNATWFKRVSGPRMIKALKALKGIARLSNPDSYEYTDKQVARMIRDLEAQIENIKEAFQNPSRTVKIVERYWA